jgi:anti-repressor protein
MDDIQLFTFNGTNIRVVEKAGQPWWVAKDVCDFFGETNRNRAMSTLTDDEKGYTQMTTPGGMQETAIVNESGLYSLLFAMQPSKARNVTDEYIEERIAKISEFKRWVTHEVLPSIRKHGAYLTPAKIEEVLLNPDTIISLATQLKEERAHNLTLSAQNAQKDQIINELKPKADYTDMILHNKGLVTITQIAKDYGMSGEAFNAKLFNMHIQYKLGGQWLLYSKYQGCGYTHSETIYFNHSNGRPDVKMNTKWTQKGRLFLYNILKSDGILPIIERKETGTLDEVSPVIIRPNFWIHEYADTRENA